MKPNQVAEQSEKVVRPNAACDGATHSIIHSRRFSGNVTIMISSTDSAAIQISDTGIDS
jgi:hypothetical protein